MKAKKPPYTAAHIANYILKKAAVENIELTNLKLQKLLYIFFGWSLVLSQEAKPPLKSRLRRRLFSDEIKALKIGPAVPSIYRQMKKFGKENIPKETQAVHYDLKKMVIKEVMKEKSTRIPVKH